MRLRSHHLRRVFRRHVVLHLSLDWSSINRPRCTTWRDPDGVGIGLSWGNGYSDPVWSIDLELWRRPITR